MLPDGMTKVMQNDAVRKLLQTGTLELPLLNSREKWCESQNLGDKVMEFYVVTRSRLRKAHSLLVRFWEVQEM